MGLFEQNPLLLIPTVILIVEAWNMLKRALTRQEQTHFE